MGRLIRRALLVALVVLWLTPAARWHARHPDHLVLTFGASSDLARQIRAGAPAAVFFSATASW